MPVEEKRARMKLLRDVVRTYNVQGWAESFLEAALSPDGHFRRSSGAAAASIEDSDFPLVASPATEDQRIA